MEQLNLNFRKTDYWTIHNKFFLREELTEEEIEESISNTEDIGQKVDLLYLGGKVKTLRILEVWKEYGCPRDILKRIGEYIESGGKGKLKLPRSCKHFLNVWEEGIQEAAQYYKKAVELSEIFVMESIIDEFKEQGRHDVVREIYFGGKK